MSIVLTKDQADVLHSSADSPMHVVDPSTSDRWVLISERDFETIREEWEEQRQLKLLSRQSLANAMCRAEI